MRKRLVGLFCVLALLISACGGDSQRFGNILYQFAKGRRVNAVLLLKRLPAPPTGPAAGCAPLGTSVPGFTNVTEGTVFPENADQRVDMSLNWLIQE